jgi:hypothetical protein
MDLPATARNGVTTPAGRVISTGMVDLPLRATPRASSHYPAVAAAGAPESCRIRHSFGAVQGREANNETRSTSVRLSLGSLPAVTGSVLLVLWAVAN